MKESINIQPQTDNVSEKTVACVRKTVEELNRKNRQPKKGSLVEKALLAPLTSDPDIGSGFGEF